jgi:hypothetical protein
MSSLVTQNPCVPITGLADINEKHDLWIQDVKEMANPVIESSEFAYKVRAQSSGFSQVAHHDLTRMLLFPQRPPILFKSTMTA